MSSFTPRRRISPKVVVSKIMLVVLLSLTAGPMTSSLPVGAFQPPASLSPRPGKTAQSPAIMGSVMGSPRSAVRLAVFNDELRDGPSEGDVADGKPAPADKMKEFLSSPWVKRAVEVNNRFWDYTCSFLYVAISCLILLNLAGFGYTISMESGLDVMPVDAYRTERQWREEIRRQEAEAAAMHPQVSLSSSTTTTWYRSSGTLQQHGALLDASVDEDRST